MSMPALLSEPVRRDVEYLVKAKAEVLSIVDVRATAREIRQRFPGEQIDMAVLAETVIRHCNQCGVAVELN